MRKVKPSCFDGVNKKFKQGKNCPFSHCNYPGEPINERRYYCLIWARFVMSIQGLAMGYTGESQIVGRRYCSREEYNNCPLKLH